METKRLLPLLAERIATDPVLAEQASNVTTAEGLIAFAKAEGADIDLEMATRLLPQFLALTANDGKLSDDTLDAVAGGVGNCTCRAPKEGSSC